MLTQLRTIVRASGSYLPERVLTNFDLEKMVETSNEWIVQRSGIHERHIAADDETTSSLAVKAAERALASAGLTADDIDLIICATTTPDLVLPSTAALIQYKLGVHQGAAFDVSAVCAGFVYGVSIADKFLKAGAFKRALVFGAETLSRIIDWTDRTTCVLFGDGAGCLILEAQYAAEDGRGVLSTHLRTDGRYHDKLYVNGGVSSTKSSGTVHMEGRDVFKFAVAGTADVVYDAFAATGLSVDNLDWFIPHQANERIIMGGAAKLGIPADKVVMTVGQHGNTSAASIPLALDTAVRDGRIKKGDLILIEALGGGFCWASGLIRW
ncbi:MAG: ketoacyl-ACP synthase III [Methylobacteriaceae bacterium]|nr:ketoacyl-ACP synthase III [Methylobacteriaceae bacterium]